MFPNHGTVLMQQEHCNDLLQEAESERLIRVAGLQPSTWLGSQMVKWGAKLQSYSLAPLPEVNSMEKIS
ncbi:MAG: hypothetical protein HYR94_15815 [Chloroflexi bacterium]|nr:hypothetical protein [Chloroflexota bacterium]